ncbi:MAG: hypothetical protein ACXVCL_11595 [Bdellovibrio sp.]
MKKNIVKYVCSLSLILPSYAFATGGIETYGGSGSGANKSSSSPAVNDSANKTSSDNTSGMVMSLAMGGIEIGAGIPMLDTPATEPMGAMLIAMGVLSMAQGVMHGDSGKQASKTGVNTSGFGGISAGGSDPLDLSNPNSLINQDPTLKASKGNLATAEKMGIYNAKAGTVKVGDKDYKVSDFSSPASMASAGLPKSMIDQAMSLSADIEKRAQDKIDKLKLGSLTAANGFDESSSGGGKSSSSDSSDSSSSRLAYANAAASKAGKGLGRDPSSFAGMQKNYNGDPIGVAADSIFLMMNRRYKAKENQDSFFTETDLALQK